VRDCAAIDVVEDLAARFRGDRPLLSDGVTEAQDPAGEQAGKATALTAIGGLVHPQAAITAVQAPSRALPPPIT
jgi:hypothetical protein